MDFTADIQANTPPPILPRQKISTKDKTDEWGKDNLLYWERQLITGNKNIEVERVKMKKNANLYFNNILDTLDVAKVVNPHNIKDFVIPLDFKHYKIENPKVQTLKGEELKRRFEWKVFVSNRDAISKKEEDKKDQYFQFITDQIKAESFNQEVAQKQLQKLQEYLTYDWQDIREKTADQLLHYYNQYLDLKTQFSRAWENGILYGQEILSVDEFNLKPIVESCDPKTIFWLKSPEQPYIDDSDCVIREYYLPLGKVIDHYYSYLSPGQIDSLERKTDKRGLEKNFSFNQYYTTDSNGFLIPNTDLQNTILNPAYLNPAYLTSNQFNFNGYYDTYGNVRVVHTRWKSMRKVGKLTFFDEQGDEQESFVDENYKVNKSKGETIEWLWVNEAWEGTRIGEDIFIKIKPRSIQYRKLDNISECSLGYVGTRVDNAIFDLIKEYSIKYDAYMHRTEQAMIKAIGKIGILDLALLPDGWDMDMWMHFATNMGWAIKDSFKEGKKGAAQGKLAGSNEASQNTIDLEQGQFIEQNMRMLQYLEAQMDKLVGINDSRQGIVAPDAGLQLTREANNASANITESYFALHDNVKLRTLRMLLEVAKYCLKNKSESLQYVTSEFTNQIFNIDGNLINEAEYDLLVGDATNDSNMINILQEAVKIALQTGQVDLIQVMDVFSSDPTSVIRRKIEKSVKAKQEQEQANNEAQQKEHKEQIAHEYQIHQDEMNDKQADRDLKQYETDENNKTKIEVAEIGNYFKAPSEDANADGIPDAQEIAKNAIEQQKVNSSHFIEQQRLSHEKQKHEDNINLEKQKIDLKKKEIEAKKKDTQVKAKAEADKIKTQKQIEDAKNLTAIRVARMRPKQTSKK